MHSAFIDVWIVESFALGWPDKNMNMCELSIVHRMNTLHSTQMDCMYFQFVACIVCFMNRKKMKEKSNVNSSLKKSIIYGLENGLIRAQTTAEHLFTFSEYFFFFKKTFSRIYTDKKKLLNEFENFTSHNQSSSSSSIFWVCFCKSLSRL